ncbi:50S ribosomal protein L33 [Streptomyces sp. NPDC085524]
MARNEIRPVIKLRSTAGTWTSAKSADPPTIRPTVERFLP